MLLPGLIASVMLLGPEVWAMGLVLLGVRGRRPIAPLAVAGLLRETMLIASVALAVRRRDPRFLVPLIVVGLWAAIVRVRFGAWFTEGAPAGAGRLGPPLLGLIRATPYMSIAIIAIAAGTLLLVLVAVATRRDDPLCRLALWFGPLALSLGPEVWIEWGGLARNLLPIQVFAFLTIARSFQRASLPSPVAA